VSDNALTKEQIYEIARKSGNGVPAGLVYAIIMEESGGQLDAKSNEGAEGLMQVLKRFHPKVDLWNPYTNVDVGTSILLSCMFSLNHIRAGWTLPSQIIWDEEAWLTRFAQVARAEEPARFEVEGMARDNSSLTRFWNGMAASPFGRNVRLISTENLAAGPGGATGGDLYYFVLQAEPEEPPPELLDFAAVRAGDAR